MIHLRLWFQIAVGIALIVTGVCWIIKPAKYTSIGMARTPSAIRASGIAFVLIGLVFSSQILPE